MCEKSNFIDILEPRKTESGIFRFMSKAWYPKRTQALDKIYSPQDIKDAVANSLYLETIIEAESSKTGENKEKLRQEVLKYIEEIGLDRKMHVIRWMGIFSLKIAFMMNIGIYVNEDAVLRLKSTMGKNPVLFLPTHRSYADFCVLTYLCYHYDIEFPAVATGMDFYHMAVIGQLLRETCAFYLRRTLAGSPLYAHTLRQYVRTLVAKHSAPVEFFLEGTRSRSNKSLPPKYGMLSMALMPLFAREVPDVTIVPVNISYDRLMEQSTFAYELLGVPKPKESTKGLVKWVSSLRGHFGNLYVRFGEPLSVRELCGGSPGVFPGGGAGGGAGGGSGGSTAPTGGAPPPQPAALQALTPDQFRQVKQVADYTVTQHQANSVATISNLLALVLMQSVAERRAKAYDEVVAEVGRMARLLRGLGATVFEDDVRKNVDRVLVVQASSWTLDKDRCLRIIASPPMEVTEDLKKKMKGHTLKAETMSRALPMLQLQLYVNPLLHYLAPPALLCVLTQRPTTIDDLSRDYHRLRKLLRYEFFHVEDGEEERFRSAYAYCVSQRVVTADAGAGSVAAGPAAPLRALLRQAVAPALAALLLAADSMIEAGRSGQAAALRRAQARAERLAAPAHCLSLDALAHALSGLAAAGALRRARGESGEVEYSVVEEVMPEWRALVQAVQSPVTPETPETPRNPVLMDPRATARL